MPKEDRREEADKDRSAGRGAKRRKLADDEQGEGVDQPAVNGSLVSDMGRSGGSDATGAAPGGSGSKAAAPTPGAGDGSDSDDDAMAPAVAALLADSDAESASSSSSSSSSSDEEGGQAEEAPRPAAADGSAGDAARGTPASDREGTEQRGAEQQDQEPEQSASAPAAAPAPASPSSESSSSSSSSDSESESADEGAEEAAGDVAEREERVAEINQYDVVKRAMLKRDELSKMLSGLPLEAAEEAIIRSYVRLAVQAGSDQDNAACVLAEVVGIEPSSAYVVNWSDGQRCTLRFRLRCRRGSSQRLVKISSVSNHELTEMEHEQWRRLTARTGVDAKTHTDAMLKKALDINKARNFVFDDKTVSDMLAKKGNLEFDAQKESRMRFLVQCAMSQMDISNIRDNEARELEERYKDSLDSLHRQEAKSTEMQSQWFEKRPNLYSLKMINKKNYERQVRDDRHALDFTLANETAGKEGLNPFQRRACRPILAWDTQLTAVEGLPTNVPTESGAGEKAAEAKAAAPTQANSSSMEGTPNGELPVNSENRMERMVRAHSGARHILAGLSGFSG